MRRRRDAQRGRALAATALLTFVAGILVVDHFHGSHRATASVRSGGPPPPAPATATVAPAMSLDDDPSVTAPPADASRDALDVCSDAVAQWHLRTAADACAEAFAARPSDATLAMRVAKVQHARGQYKDAGEWAGRAIALHTIDADAFVILAHAETRARHPRAARAAYRQYLAMAPRGWHASEARRAIRASIP
jgi:hypothetical protein